MNIEDYAERVECDEAWNEIQDRAIYNDDIMILKCDFCGMPLFVRTGVCFTCQNCGTTTGCG